MSQQIIEMHCPGCGARVSTSQKECEWCHQPIVISTFNSIYPMPSSEANKYANVYREILAENPENAEINNSIAMCYLKLKLYDKALQAFQKVMEQDSFNNSETYFYAAVSILRGKKAFLAQRADIDKALEYLNAAIMIEPKGIYFYFLAYIKYDFFERKCLNTSPNYIECIQMSVDKGTSDYDKKLLFDILAVSLPEF